MRLYEVVSVLPPPTSEAERPESPPSLVESSESTDGLLAQETKAASPVSPTTPHEAEPSHALAVPECFQGALNDPPQPPRVPNPFVAGDNLTLNQHGQGLINSAQGRVAKAMGRRALPLFDRLSRARDLYKIDDEGNMQV